MKTNNKLALYGAGWLLIIGSVSLSAEPQVITSQSGDRLVVLSESDYQTILREKEIAEALEGAFALKVDELTKRVYNLEHPATLVSGYYVSSNGSDANSGTLDAPFKSLAKAQAAMRAGAIKITYVRAGTYPLAAKITLQAADKGEVWQGYPGETPLLTGAGTAAALASAGASGVTIAGLAFDNFKNAIELQPGNGFVIRGNTLTHCVQVCIWGSNSSNVVVDKNKIDGGGGAATYYAGIYFHQNSNSVSIIGNDVRNMIGPGITVGAAGTETMNDFSIDGNTVVNVNTGLADSGAIYVLDRGHTSHGGKITNNVIDGAGAVGKSTKAIYLDDRTSNILVSGNAVKNCGTYCLQIHGGDHNIVELNRFDLSSGARLSYYQDAGLPNFGMAGNVFRQNIIVTYGAWPVQPWLWLAQQPIQKPAVNDNRYWSSAGAAYPNTGQIVDSNPIYPTSNPW